MRKLGLLFFYTLISFALLSCSSSGGGEGNSISVDKSEVDMIGLSASATLQVKTNLSWSVTVPTTSWLTVSPTSGTGDATVTCSSTSNSYREKRQAKIVIHSTDVASTSVTVNDSIPNTAPNATADALYPTDAQTNVLDATLSLRWKPSIDVDGDRVFYNVDYSLDGNTWTSIAKKLNVPFYSNALNLAGNTKYYWRVQTYDEFGTSSGYSKTFTFTTAASPGDWGDGEVRLYQNCINSTATDPFTLIVTGDGFVASDLKAGGMWDVWSKRAIQGLLGDIEPYKTWGNYLRIIRLGAVSQESGISQHDWTSGTDKCNVVVNTKYGTYYDNTDQSAFCGIPDNETVGTGGSETKALTWIQSKLQAAGYNITKNYAVLFILNVSHYNGTVYYTDIDNNQTTGFVCLCPGAIGTQTGFENVVCHEIGGHAIGHFADLYISGSGTLSDAKKNQTADYQSHGWYQNVSLTSNKAASPWGLFFQNTKDHDTYYSLVDIFQGARSVAYGIWRPQNEATCMDDNRFIYDAPSRYSIVKQLKAAVGEDKNFTWEEFVNKDYDKDNSISTRAFLPVKNAPKLPEPIYRKWRK